MEENLLTTNEVAKILRVDRSTVLKWIKAGLLKAQILPHGGKRRQYRITRKDLQCALESALDGAC